VASNEAQPAIAIITAPATAPGTSGPALRVVRAFVRGGAAHRVNDGMAVSVATGVPLSILY